MKRALFVLLIATTVLIFLAHVAPDAETFFSVYRTIISRNKFQLQSKVNTIFYVAAVSASININLWAISICDC